MKIALTFTLLLLLGLSGPLFGVKPAQAQPLPAEDVPFKEFEQHGDLFTVKVVPAGKETHLYLVGKDAAKIKYDKVSLVGKMDSGEDEKLIEFEKQKEYFVTRQVLHGHVLHLKAKDEATQKSEEFHVDLKKRP